MGLQYLEMPNKLRSSSHITRLWQQTSVCLCLSAGPGYYIYIQDHQTEKGFSIAKLNMMFSATVGQKNLTSTLHSRNLVYNRIIPENHYFF